MHLIETLVIYLSVTHTSTTMAEDVAVILANIRAAQDEHRARPGAASAIHVLILACFAHIFLMLEVMVAQWSAGLLPAPAPRAPRRHNARAARQAAQRPDSIRTPRRAPTGDTPAPMPQRPMPRQHVPRPAAPPLILRRAAPSRPAPPAPSPPRLQKPAWTTSPTHAHIVPLS